MITSAALNASFVPPERWGALLHRSRMVAGRTLVAVSRELEGWTPQRLAEVEQGGGVPDGVLGILAAAYRVPAHSTRSAQWRLVLDRSTTVRSRRDEMLGLIRSDGLLRLRAVLRAAGGSSSTAPELDRGLVAEWLGADVSVVGAAMKPGFDDTGELEAVSQQIRSRSCVPAVGLLIGETVSGSLSLVGTVCEVGHAGASNFPTVMTVGEWARLVNPMTELLASEVARAQSG